MMKRQTPAPRVLPRPRVVVADADQDTQALYDEAFRSLPADIVAATDGRDALVQCCIQPPALLITDTRLPFIDGFSLCELLRNDPLTRDVPIIVVTAEVRPAVLLPLRRLGGITVLAKPVAVETLKAAIERVHNGTGDSGGLSESDEDVAVDEVPRAPYQTSATRRFRRSETSAPATLPPPLRCPSCDRQLEFRKSRIGGVTSRDAERWDELGCPDCRQRFEYRHRTKSLRPIR